MRDLTAKFTTDVIGTCAFGLECNSLKNSQSEFRRMGCAVLNSSPSLALAKTVRVFFPKLFKALKLRTFPIEVQKFFIGIVKQTINFRNANGVRRNDFIQLLLELKNQNDNENTFKLTEELIAAQVTYFRVIVVINKTYCENHTESYIMILSIDNRYLDIYTQW